MGKWEIHYDHELCDAEYSFDHWIVTDGKMSFVSESENDAVWLCDNLNTAETNKIEIARLQHIVDEKPLTFLRGLEDEAIEKLIHQNDELRSAISKAAGDLSFLDAALNSGDGSYRP